MWTSSDGVTFSEIKSVSNPSLNEYSGKNMGSGFGTLLKITNSNNKLIAVGNGGLVVTSPRPTTVSI